MRTEIILRVYQGVSMFLNIVSMMLVVYAFMTWFVRPDAPVYRFMNRFCEPLLAPFRPIARRLIEYGLRIDISVILAIAAIRVLERLLYRLLYLLL